MSCTYNVPMRQACILNAMMKYVKLLDKNDDGESFINSVIKESWNNRDKFYIFDQSYYDKNDHIIYKYLIGDLDTIKKCVERYNKRMQKRYDNPKEYIPYVITKEDLHRVDNYYYQHFQKALTKELQKFLSTCK